MLLRRLLGIFVLSFAIIYPLAATSADDKAPTDPAAKKAADEKAKADADKKAPDDKAKAEADKKAAEDKAKTKTLLEWKFVKGKDFYQKMTTDTTQNMTVMTNKVTQKQKQTFYFKWSVVDKNDKGDWIIKQKIEGIDMNIQIGNQNIAYDSTKDKEAPGNTPLSDFFKSLKDAEFTITLNPKTMAVTKIEGATEFVAKLGKQNPQMEPLLKQILSEDALKQMAEPTFAAIPGTEKSVGDKWTKKTSLNMGPIGKYDNEYTYTYEGKDKDNCKIKVETTLKYTAPDANNTPGGAAGTGGLPFKITSADLKSTKAEGTILFNPELGRIVSSTMNLKLVGTIKIEIGGQTTEVTLDQDQTSTVENSDKPLLETKK